MRKVSIASVVFAIRLCVHGQGQFTVNFKGDGNDVRFLNSDRTPLNGTEGYKVEIFAGSNILSLQPVGSLALNRTSPGADFGYPNPFSGTFSFGSGRSVLVGYAMFAGPDYATSTMRDPLVAWQNGLIPGNGPTLRVDLTQPPSTVALGVGTYPDVPEPSTWTLLSIGVLGLLVGCKRKSCPT